VRRNMMSGKSIRTPGPDHPITIEPFAGRVVVRAAGRIIADTTRALCLREASYPGVFYFPREDSDIEALTRTTHSTHCPYKGDASYFSLPIGSAGTNGVWTYENPYPAVAEIREHLAFYPDRVTIEAMPA
jgi:uncharacterized protein (DUF427 family)